MPLRLMVAGVLTASVVWSCGPASEKDGTAETDNTGAEVSAAIKAQLPELSPRGEVLRIEDPTQPAVLKLPSGTEIRVPAHSFVNEAGAPVTDPVEITVTEYHDAADIIAAGIPMHTQGSDGQREWLQTAGMFDIRGASRGRSIFVAPGSSLQVQFASRVGGEYDHWIFDEKAGSWSSTGRGNSPLPLAVSESGPGNNDVVSERAPVPPRKPQPTPEAERLVFNDLDYKRCPDLKDVSSLVLTYAGKDPALDPKNNTWITQPGIWLKKELRPGKEPGIYQLTLVGDSLYTIPVKKALTTNDLAAATAEYEKALAEYNANLALFSQQKEIRSKQNAFRREMAINGFGLYNYDILWKTPDAVRIAADFEFDNLPENLKESVTVYHITGRGRAVIALGFDEWKYFGYSPGSDNAIIALLPNDKVALFTQSDFKKASRDLAASQSKSYTFQMRVKDRQSGVTDLQNLVAEAKM